MTYYKTYIATNAGLSAWGQSDILYKQLNLLIPNFYLFILVISFIYILTLFLLIKNNIITDKYWFSLLLLLINPYLFLVHLSSIRQTLAICFFIFSVHYAIKRKLVIYILLVTIAAGFHSSAIFLLPVYFILNDSKIEKTWVIIIYVILLVMLGTPIFEIILNKILSLEFIPPHYRYYFNLDLRNSLRATIISGFFFFLVILNLNKLEGNEIIYGKLSLIATIITLLAYKVSMITRIGMYFDIFLVITIPQIFSKIQKKVNKQVLFIIMIIIYLIKYISFFNNPIWSDSYSIYKTILFKN